MTEMAKILVVDDDMVNRALLSELLKGDYKVVLAKSGLMALELAARHRPDLILLDVVMPGMDGYEVIRRLKANSDTRDIPVIFISALDGVHDEEMGLILGASDYIGKPFHPPIVRARVSNHIRALRQTRLLERLALYDALTEIPNRYRLINALSEQVTGPSASVIMIDVDHFKLYNDRYGHGSGDRVLRQVAGTLQSQLRHVDDLVARYGGEEFAVLLVDTDRAMGIAVADRMRRAILELAIPHENSPSGDVVTASFGGASFAVSDGPLPGEALGVADRQLYRAKADGRNRVNWDGGDITDVSGHARKETFC